MREQRNASRPANMRKFDVTLPGAELDNDQGTVVAAVDGVPVKALLLDTGADTSLVTRGVLEALDQTGRGIQVSRVDGVKLSPVGGRVVDVSHIATYKEVVLTTSAGPLMIRNLACSVEEENLSLRLTVGRPIMKILGYSNDKLLVDARSNKPEWGLGGSTLEKKTEPSQLQKMCRLHVEAWGGTAASDAEDDGERHETRTALPTMLPTNIAEVILYLEAKVRGAEELGLTLDGAAKLHGVLHARADNFRVEFSHDPPVRVAPMKVRLREGAAPVRSQPRRYLPNDRAFLERHTASLLMYGLIYKNHRSRWALAPRIVRKKEQDVDPTADPRMTIDTRSVNERTESMLWPMPVLEVVLGELEGAKVFFVLDWFRGYWQLPLHPDAQELYSFATHRRIYTPTLVPLGATDAVAYCQGAVEESFGDLLGVSVLARLDTILGFAEDEDALLDVLDTVLKPCSGSEDAALGEDRISWRDAGMGWSSAVVFALRPVTFSIDVSSLGSRGQNVIRDR